MIIGNWKILSVYMEPPTVRALCMTCKVTTKICRIRDIQSKPNSVCRKCYLKRTKVARDTWAGWGKVENASACTTR